MHWWQSTFSSPSSSSARHSSDDNFLNRFTFKSDVVNIFSSGGRGINRRLTRARKLRHLTDDDVGHASSARSSSSVSPQPLPLPELAMLLRRDARRDAVANSNLSKYILPSPKDVLRKSSGENRDNSDSNLGDANGFPSILCSSDGMRKTEQMESQLFQKSPQGQNDTKRKEIKYWVNDPISAPTSLLSSPTVSPPGYTVDMFTSYYMSPPVIQVWSAQEMRFSDMSLGLGYPHQMFPEKTTFSIESSPLPSPRLSPRQNIRSLGPTSPKHKTLSIETSAGWRDSNARRDSNAQAIPEVHPLPLPPGASVPPVLSPGPQAKAIPEPTPMKSQWQKGKLIGRGTFGSVYVASNRETGALCAMKEVELLPDDPKSAECIKQLEQEIEVLSQLKHPNIVQYYGSEIVDDRFFIYLEYVHPGSINKYIRDHCGAITESIVRNFTRHILSGLAYLHSMKTIHRDIKGANLLVDANGVVKLADFGMAKHLNEQASHLSLKGSPYWMAPELLQCGMQKDSNPDLALAVDIWSLGCTIIEMMNGKPPWSDCEGPAALFKVLKESPPIPETMSPEGKDFLRLCFRRNPAERPSASVLLEHRFLKHSNFFDAPLSAHPLNGMTLMDKAHNHRQRPSKLDQLPLPMDPLITKGKLVNNSSFMHDSFSPVRLTNDVILKLPT